jgi:hypothetical protein
LGILNYAEPFSEVIDKALAIKLPLTRGLGEASFTAFYSKL